MKRKNNKVKGLHLTTLKTNKMRTPILTLTFILFSVLLFGQNENPYSQFGYEAPIMPEKSKSLIQNKMDRLYLINTDSASVIGMLAIDATKRNITVFDKKGFVLQVDTLNDYSMARWLSVDPYGQFSSPYVGMGNRPNMGVDPDGGLFGLSAGWSALAGAGIGFAVGAGAAVLTGNEDDWWKWGAVGAVAGGAVGFATGETIVQHGSKTKSITGGKIHDNRTYSKFEQLKQQKFKGSLQKEFYLDLGSDFSGMSGKTVRFAKEVFRFNEKYTKEVRFKINSSNSIFSLERNGQEIFTNQHSRDKLETPDYRNNGETFRPAVTHEFPVYDDEAIVIGLRRTVSITRRVKGLYLSRIHGSGWNIVR